MKWQHCRSSLRIIVVNNRDTPCSRSDQVLTTKDNEILYISLFRIALIDAHRVYTNISTLRQGLYLLHMKYEHNTNSIKSAHTGVTHFLVRKTDSSFTVTSQAFIAACIWVKKQCVELYYVLPVEIMMIFQKTGTEI